MNSGCSKSLQLIITVLCEFPLILESHGDGDKEKRKPEFKRMPKRGRGGKKKKLQYCNALTFEHLVMSRGTPSQIQAVVCDEQPELELPARPKALLHHHYPEFGFLRFRHRLLPTPSISSSPMNQITAFFDVRQTLKLHEIQAQIDRDRPQKPKPNKHKPGAPNPNRQNPNRLETPESLEDVEPQGCS
jgi:hypothetical protein